MKINPLLESDFYKQVHWNQYPKDVVKVVSYFTPRMSRLKNLKFATDQDKLLMFGLQSFIKEWLIEDFNENFFNRDKAEVMKEADRLLDCTIQCNCGTYRFSELYDLGYLPIEIKALPEGTRVPVGCPMFEISNTHPDFAWLTNALESRISAELWHTMISANVGYEYRKIVNEYYEKTVCGGAARKALGDFSMRGQESAASAYKSSAAWLLSHVNTATVCAIPYLEKYYNCSCEDEEVGFGSASTEHSVMCSNFAVDGDEDTMITRLLTEIYPYTSFSMVSDSYDYWDLVKNKLPKHKEEILEHAKHKNVMLIRGDSGDPVEVVTKTVFELAKWWGYTINKKGYKVLNFGLKAIYGDSITLTRIKEIYKILEKEGWSVENVVLGVGSFSMECFEDGDKLYPYTRDTFGIAIKATHVVMKDGTEHFVFKNPKESTFKKSHKGCCVVLENQNGLYCHDEMNFVDTYSPANRMEVVFKDGKMVKEYSLKEVRERLWDGKFYG